MAPPPESTYSSAADLVALTRFVMETQPYFRQTVARGSATISMGGRQRVVTNLNTLVGRVRWVTGVKTGHTLDAGYVLVGDAGTVRPAFSSTRSRR